MPDFQRPYSWGINNAETMIEDLEASMQSEKKHFFGSIVWINDQDERVIIDGQQRITTILLMLIAIYHVLRQSGEEENKRLAERINEEFLYDKYNEEHKRLKLRTVVDDNEVFKNIYEGDFKPQDYRHLQLYRVYNYFYEYFKEKPDLQQYISALGNLDIIDLCIDDSNDSPQKIFESINSTGKSLQDGDKIRNFILMTDSKQAREIIFHEYWKVIEQSLSDGKTITDFFFNFLISVNDQEIRVKNIYSEFKTFFHDRISDQSDISQIRNFYNQVLSYLKHYMFLRFNKDENRAYGGLANVGFRLNYLKVFTTTPLLMNVLEDFVNQELSEEEARQIFHITESYIVRRILIGASMMGSNKSMPGIFGNMKQMKKEHPESSYSEIYAHILSEKKGFRRFPRDEELASSIPALDFYSNRGHYKKFILTSIDDCLQSKESFLLKEIASSERQLTVEHIMPRSLNAEWKLSLGQNYQEIHDKYLHTLANLTLSGYNSKYSNSSFKDKKEMPNGFNESTLLINDFIKKQDVWDRDALDRRSEWWIEQVTKIWPVITPSIGIASSSTKVFRFDDLLKTDFTGTKPYQVVVFNDFYGVDSWSDLLDTVFESFYSQDPDFKTRMLKDEMLYDQISENADDFLTSNEIFDTGIFVNSHSSTERKIHLINRLGQIYGIDKEDLEIHISR